MTLEQAAILLLLVGMLVVFALDRFRLELVAIAGLAIGVAFGLVGADKAFAGFANPAFITVVEILLIVQVLARSGALDPIARRIPEVARSETGVVALLCAACAGLSVFMNNIGALALMLPVTASVCRVAGIDQHRVLMPVSFAALLGGLCSVIGTPANLIVSGQLRAATGQGFAFFDFAWAGAPVALVGLFLLVTWPRHVLRPASPESPRLPPQALRQVITEVEIVEGSQLVGRSLASIDIVVHGVRRAGANLLFQRPGTMLQAADIILAEIPLPRLEAWLADRSVRLPERPQAPDRGERVEVVVMPESTLVGSRIASLDALSERGIRVIAVASQTSRIEGSLADFRLSIGDVLYLAGDRAAIDDMVEETESLPLWPKPADADNEPRWRPAILFAAGVGLAMAGLAPPELSLGLVVLVLVMTGDLNLRKGLADLNWPILIMLATLIPLGEAVETTGAGAMLADVVMDLLPSHGSLMLSAAMLLIAVAITPFVNNAATAIVLGPIAVGIAQSAGIGPQPLLIAVALGASIDFLTPIGHHNNTIVMGLAGYRFSDFVKAGWPLTLAACIVGLLAISLFWV